MDRGNRNRCRLQHDIIGSRRGFTLVEILVVLVVLLIGILAILRLFPSGFLSIQRTGEQTGAQALTQQQLDAERNLPGLPDGIGAALPDNNGNIQEISNLLDVNNYLSPENLGDVSGDELTTIAQDNNFTLPAGYSPYFFSDVNKIRYIKGEVFPIPTATPNSVSSAYGAIYTLQFGPVYNVFHTDASGNPADSLKVTGAPMTRLVESSQSNGYNNYTAPTDLTNDTQYAIDYTSNPQTQTPMIAFFPRITDPSYNVNYRLFTLAYQAYNASGSPTLIDVTLQLKVYDQPVPQNGAMPLPIWMNPFNQNDTPNAYPYQGPTQVIAPANTTLATIQGYQILQGTDQVSRQFRLVTTTPVTATGGPNAPTWSKDPYEYAWYSPQETGNANRGVLIFNPRGHVSFLDPNATNTSDAEAQAYINQQTISAHISYLTFDNHIIRDDRSVPSGPPYRVKLSLSFVLGQNDILPNQYTYEGIYTDPTVDNSKVTDGADVTVVNMNTGQKLCDIVGGVSTQGSLLNATLDPKAGIITFAQTANGNNGKGIEDLNLQNAAIRAYYRAQKDFGMQVQKASAQYNAVPTVAALNSSSFYIGTGQPGGGSATRLYFPVSEAGKTINIGEFYYVNANSNTGQPETYPRETNQTFQIVDDPKRFDLVNGLRVAWIDIHDVFPDAIGFSAIPTGRAVNYVQGASLKSRVIWSDSGRAVNNTPPNKGLPTGLPYWRRIDNDSIIQPRT